MAHITVQEVRKLAEISRIHVDDDEVDVLAKEMENVLEYASSLQSIAQQSSLSMLRSAPRNVFRSDVVEEWNTDALLDQAPHEAHRYYVVPKVIKQS